jgi:hypothetical protein
VHFFFDNCGGFCTVAGSGWKKTGFFLAVSPPQKASPVQGLGLPASFKCRAHATGFPKVVFSVAWNPRNPVPDLSVLNSL